MALARTYAMALVPSMRVISAETLGSLVDWLRFGDLEESGPSVGTVGHVKPGRTRTHRQEP